MEYKGHCRKSNKIGSNGFRKKTEKFKQGKTSSVYCEVQLIDS